MYAEIEALYEGRPVLLMADGITTPDMIDNVAKRLLGPRLCVTGLLEQKESEAAR